MWYKNKKIVLTTPTKRSPAGRYEKNEALARKLGFRYKKWGDVAKNWFANAGITRPYGRFIFGKPFDTYNLMLEHYAKGEHGCVLDLEHESVSKGRQAVKNVFGNECSVLFDTNGSCVISTITKSLRGTDENFSTLTFSDQGRLVYSALGFEAKSMVNFRQNFEQQLGLFEASSPNHRISASTKYPKNVKVINLFYSDNTYRPDGVLMDEFLRTIKTRRDIKMVLLLHVSRTGRILPVEEMIRIARSARDDIAIFVDGCQAIGRIPFQAMKRVYDLADGYIFVGHKALGSMICGAAAIKKDVEQKFANLIDHSLLHIFKLFQFESEELNLKILQRSKKTGKHYFLVSAPEILSLASAMDEGVNRYWADQDIIGRHKASLTSYLNSLKTVHLNVHSCPIVDDLVSFHMIPASRGSELKQYLQNLNPPITIAPLTENLAVRIAIDPKMLHLDGAVAYLKDSVQAFERQTN